MLTMARSLRTLHLPTCPQQPQFQYLIVRTLTSLTFTLEEGARRLCREYSLYLYSITTALCLGRTLHLEYNRRVKLTSGTWRKGADSLTHLTSF